MKMLFSLLCLFSCLSLSGQMKNDLGHEILELQKHIDSLHFIQDYNQVKIDKARELQGLADLQYSTYRFSECYKLSDKQSRILCLTDVRNFEIWRIRNSSKFYRDAQSIYISATRQLIEAYAGDLANLKQIEVYPFLQAQLYPSLKKAIENAGGVWDRGSLPELTINPPLKGINDEN